MRGVTFLRSVLLVGFASAMTVAVGCESSADRAAGSDGYTTGGTHGVGSSGQALPDSPIGGAPASPNTNGIRNEQTVGERGATGSVSSGAGAAANTPATGSGGSANPSTPASGASGNGSISNGSQAGSANTGGAAH